MMDALEQKLQIRRNFSDFVNRVQTQGVLTQQKVHKFRRIQYEI